MTTTVLDSPFDALLPFTVNLNVPRGEERVVTDNFVVPEVVTDVGENDALLPEGNPVTLNTTGPVYEFFGVTLTLYVAVDPFVTVVDVGDALNANDCGGGAGAT